MAFTTAEDRVAVLLNLLGTDVADGVLQQVSSDQQKELRRSLEAFDETPPSPQTVDEIVDEFERLLQEAGRNANRGADVRPGSIGATKEQAASDEDDSASEADEPFELTDDPLHDLTRLSPHQIAAALQGESPHTIALVVDCLDSAQGANVLGSLPDEIGREVFVKMNADLQPPPELLQKIVATMVRKASVLDDDSLQADESGNSQKIADLLRSMERDQRGGMLDALEQFDADSAAKVKELLYVFDDLLAIEDRSLQKLLTEVDSRTLATSLKDGDPELIDKVVRNFSKRARAALMEEMDYLGTVKEDEQQSARKEIADIIARLDQTGELVMES